MLEVFEMPKLSRVISKSVLPLIVLVLLYSLAICCTFLGLFLKNPSTNPAVASGEPFYDHDPTVSKEKKKSIFVEYASCSCKSFLHYWCLFHVPC